MINWIDSINVYIRVRLVTGRKMSFDIMTSGVHFMLLLKLFVAVLNFQKKVSSLLYESYCLPLLTYAAGADNSRSECMLEYRLSYCV